MSGRGRTAARGPAPMAAQVSEKETPVSDPDTMAESINPLEVLLELESAGSLSVAASRMGKTPSAVSKLIRQLEARLGRMLVEHAARPLRLTEAGRAYVEAARTIRNQLRETDERVAALTRDPGGRLRLTASLLFGHTVLAPYIVTYRRAFPQVRVEVILCDDYVDLEREDFDLAIRHGQNANANFIARSLGTNNVWLCGAPSYFSRRGTPAKPEDLLQHDCLNFRAESLDSRWRFHKGSRTVSINPPARLSSNSDGFLQASMRAGDGLLPCFEWAVSEELRAGTLQACLTKWQFDSEAFGEQQLWAVYPRGQRGNAKVKQFVDGLIVELAQRRADGLS